MNKHLFLLPLFAVMFLGAGCASSAVAPTTDLPIVNSGTSSTTDTNPATATTTRANWQTDIFPEITFQHPGTSTPVTVNSDEAKQGLILTVNLGTAVAQPGSKSVPQRTLKVSKVKTNDPRLGPCTATLMGTQGVDKVSSVTNAEQQKFCLLESGDAGAGNYYNTNEYILPTADGGYAFTFTVHSVQCANFERPDEQCVAYDASRDTAIFHEIIGTVRDANAPITE